MNNIRAALFDPKLVSEAQCAVFVKAGRSANRQNAQRLHAALSDGGSGCSRRIVGTFGWPRPPLGSNYDRLRG
jgi:hypothetical protein